tara:strand:+ start:95 stop:643 length:549 start_codon:yes stop_codon:yes gene_type:complete
MALSKITTESILDGEITTAKLASGTGGKVLQIQSSLSTAYASTTTIFGYDDTIAQNTEGVELVTLAFTPQSSSSKLLFMYGGSFNVGQGSSIVNPCVIALYVDSTANAIAQASATVDGGGTRVMSSWAYHLETNSSTSERTYKMRWGRSGQGGSTNYINGDTSARLFGGKLASGFYITEYAN